MNHLLFLTQLKPKHYGLRTSLIAASLALSACDESSKTEDPPVVIENVSPTVSADSTTITEGEMVTLSATGTDTDGTVETYSWTQTSGDTVSLTGADSASLSFTAPIVTEDQTLEFEVSVTDDDGATGSTSVSVDVSAIMLGVTISGLVTDSPISDANVEMTIGGQSFTTQADDEGAYSLEISLDDSYASELVTAIATGSEESSVVKLVSYLGTLESVIEVADEDGIVTAGELFNTNITNVSTANAVALEIAAGEEITSAELLYSAQSSVNGELILPLATAIKLVIDYAEENSELALPEGVLDTFELVSNQEDVAAYIANALENAADTYAAAEADIITDTNLLDTNLDEDSIAGTYYFLSPNGYYGEGNQLTLNADGTGVQISLLREDTNSGETELTWALTDSGLELTYVDPEIIVRSVVIVNGVNIEDHESHIAKNIAIVAEFADSMIVSTSDTSLYEYPNGELETLEYTAEPESKTLYKSSAIQNSAGVLEMGVEYLLSIPEGYETLLRVSPDGLGDDYVDIYTYTYIATFSGDPESGGSAVLQVPSTIHEGSTVYYELATTWSIADSGQLIIENEDVYIEASVLYSEDDDVLISSVSHENLTSGSVKADSGPIIKKIETWTEESVVGIYAWDVDEWINVAGGYEWQFWLEVDEGGTGQQVSTSKDENDEWVYNANPFLWQLDENGELSIRRYANSDSSDYWCTPTSFDPSPQEDCNLAHERIIELYALKDVNNEPRAYVLHSHKYYDDTWARIDAPNYTDHILTYSDFTAEYWLKLDDRPVEIDDITAMSTAMANSVLTHAPSRRAPLTALPTSK